MRDRNSQRHGSGAPTWCAGMTLVACLWSVPTSAQVAAQLPEKSSSDFKFSRDKLRYAGQTWEHWRDLLVYELEPESRVKALEAVGAFGRNGFAEEAVAAIGEVLQRDEPELNEFQISEAACKALVRCGTPAIPILESQLRSPGLKGRDHAVEALCYLAKSTDLAIPALLKATGDDEPEIRKKVYRVLADEFPTGPGVMAALEVGLSADDDEIPGEILSGLVYSSRRFVNFPAAPLLALMEHLDDSMRIRAALAAALHIGPSAPVMEQFRRQILQEESTCGTFADGLLDHDLLKLRGNAGLVVPLLVASVESGFCDEHAIRLTKALGALQLAGPGWDSTVVLLKIAEGRYFGAALEPRFEAIDALRRARATAFSSLPTLIRLLDCDPIPADSDWDDSIKDLWRRHWKAKVRSAVLAIKGTSADAVSK